jgi:D-xylose 1-dehydrogenase (NADP+, D-xylono-1,5-lactone-forming)
VGLTRWGLLSTAAINEAILEGIRRSDLAEVVAVSSRDASRAEAYAREHGIGRAHGSYEALLADPDVDVVYVALPNALHVEWAIRALEAGKHVLSEKPLSVDPAEVERAFDAAERADRVLMEGFMWRQQPQAKRLAELARDGTIGEVRLVRAQFSFTLTRPDDVRWLADLGGGALLDVGCYCVSALRLVAGEPETVFAQKVVAPGGADVRFTATVRFESGALGHFDCGFDVPMRRELEVVGSDGVLFLEPAFGSDHGVLRLRRGGDEFERIDLPETHRYQLEVENFSRATRGEEAPLLDRAESVAQARALAALLRSAETDRPARLVGTQES